MSLARVAAQRARNAVFFVSKFQPLACIAVLRRRHIQAAQRAANVYIKSEL